MKKWCCLVVVLMGIAGVYAQSTGSGDEPLYIVFPANSADLKTVRTKMGIDNSQVFTKVAQLLAENPTYRILVDGHANPVMKTKAEEKDALKPLSTKRAEAAADFLVTYYGIDRSRLILSGAGGTYPFGNSDPSLNRRVSFFIIQPR